MLLEERRPDQRNVFQNRNGQLGDSQGIAGERKADIGGGPYPEERQGQATSHLVGPQPDRQPGKGSGHHGSHNSAQHKAQRRAARLHGHGKAHNGRHQHHAFRAQIDDARFFIDQQTQGCQEQRDQTLGDEHVTSQQGKQEDALENAGNRIGQTQTTLGQFPTDIKQGHHKRGKYQSQRVQSPHKGHDNGRKTIARRNRRGQLPNRAHDFCGTRQPSQCTRNQQGAPQGFTGGKAGIPSCQGSHAAHSQTKTGHASCQKEPGSHRSDQRQHNTAMQASAGQDGGQQEAIRKQAGLRKAETIRITQGTMHQIAEQVLGHIDQHQGHQNLVGIETVFQESHNRGPGHATEHAAGQGDE
uniref:DUF4157 domain-containing protein n=1 Tax=Steinernema glaseri TaxID=37863 RepID=A0A1I8AMJ4_9BILA